MTFKLPWSSPNATKLPFYENLTDVVYISLFNVCNLEVRLVSALHV